MELLARSYRSYGVIRSYPRVDGVIGNTGLYLPGLSELLLSELWGYKVIPQGGWSYREYRVIPPRVIGVIDVELSELWGYKVIPWGMTL